MMANSGCPGAPHDACHDRHQKVDVPFFLGFQPSASIYGLPNTGKRVESSFPWYDFISACPKVGIFGGYWLKPVANEQIMSSFTEDMVHAFMKLGERYPDIAGEIYIIASNH